MCASARFLQQVIKIELECNPAKNRPGDDRNQFSCPDALETLAFAALMDTELPRAADTGRRISMEIRARRGEKLVAGARTAIIYERQYNLLDSRFMGGILKSCVRYTHRVIAIL